MTKTPRFLVLRGGAIGDFILTLPVLQALKQQWPAAHIEVVGYPHIAVLAQVAGWAERIVSLDRAHFARFFSLRPALGEALTAYVRSFDLVVSFLHDPDGVVRRNLLATGVRQVLYISPVQPNVHVCDHLVKPLETLAIYAAGMAPSLPWPGVRVAAGRARLTALGLRPPILALHPGSGSVAKNWPARRYHELAALAITHGWSPVYLFGEADRDPASALRMLGDATPAIEGLELTDVADVLAAADAFAGNDSGITHLAAALGRPCVALFGPTDPAIWGPRGERVKILRAPGQRLGDVTAEEVWTSLIALNPLEPPSPSSPAPERPAS